MSITTSAAAGVLDNFAARLGQVADAKAPADEFLTVLARATGVVDGPVNLSFADIADVTELRAAWGAMHDAVDASLAHLDGAPTFGSAGVTDAKQLVGRLGETELRMTAMEVHPRIVRDVADIARDIRSRVDDVTNRGQRGVAAEARLLHSITG